MQQIVLFGAGSPLLVDFEESCHRLGIVVAAIIRNIAGEDYASGPDKIVSADAMPAGLTALAFAIALAAPANRRIAADHARALGAKSFPPLLDATAILPSRLDVAEGVFVNAGAIIGAASRLEEFSLVNRGAVLGHHFRLGTFASIGPGVTTGGLVTIENDATIGTGATILPQLRIGHHAVVSAGSVVTRDVAPLTLVAGNPARFVRRLEPH